MKGFFNEKYNNSDINFNLINLIKEKLTNCTNNINNYLLTKKINFGKVNKK
jgi:hypothetical protein